MSRQVSFRPPKTTACDRLHALHLAVAQRLYPIPYQYGRMALPLVLLLCLSVAKGAVPLGPTFVALGSKVLLLAAFPLLLWACGFFTAEERRVLRQFVHRMLRRQGRPELNERPHSAGPSLNGPVLGGRSTEALEKGDEETSARLPSITSRMRAATPPVGERL
jgi:hypothetical protein